MTKKKLFNSFYFYFSLGHCGNKELCFSNYQLKIYGFNTLSINWFKNFLTGRSQKVKIGKILSTPKCLESGVPQGGILSPVIFIIYGADMSAWLRHSACLTYADDTSTSATGKTIEETFTYLNLLFTLLSLSKLG